MRGKKNHIPTRLMAMYRLMYENFGPQHWWPGETPFEVIVGAVLAQNTNWQNASKAVGNLKAAGMLSLEKLRAAPGDKVARLIRTAGYYNLKEKRLRNLLDMLARDFGGDLARLFSLPLAEAREALLSCKGVGPETADSILLYAGGLPSFVIDAYTIRILERHGLARAKAGYGELRTLFMDSLPPDPELFNEFHALFVRLGNGLCKKGSPLCGQCPLSGF